MSIPHASHARNRRAGPRRPQAQACALAAAVALGLALAPAPDVHGQGATVMPAAPAVPAQATWPPTETPVAPTSVARNTPLPLTPSAQPSTGSPAAPTVTPTAPAAPADLDRPILRVADTSVDPGTAVPGQAIDVRIEVENVGAHDAEHVQLTLGGTVFLALDRGAVLYKEEIDAGETRPFTARLQVDSAAQSGVFALTMDLRWEDAAGGAYSTQTSVGIQVVAPAKGRPVVAVTSAAVPPRCVPGTPFAVQLVVTNGGSQEARNLVIVPTAGPLALAGGEQPPTNLAPGATATVRLVLVASAVQAPGATSQTLELRYDDPDGQRLTDTTVIGISVAGDALLGPQPMVTGYRIAGRRSSGEALHPGEVFELELDVANVGARDCLATRLALGGGAGGTGAGAAAAPAALGSFAPLGTSNVRFLDRLAAGAKTVVRQRMIVDGSAKPGSYVLEVAFAFADPDGVARSSSEVITLLVGRRINLAVNPVAVITATQVGAEVPFSVELVNAGDSKVNVGNAEIAADRSLEVRDGTVFVGPVDGGAVFPLDATLVAVSAGKARVTVKIAYTDDFGQSQTYERVFDVTVEAPPEAPEAVATVPPPADQGFGLRLAKGLLGLGASPRYALPALPPTGEPVIIRGGASGATIRDAPAKPDK